MTKEEDNAIYEGWGFAFILITIVVYILLVVAILSVLLLVGGRLL